MEWTKYAKTYDPTKIGSIDGTDTEPHDRGIVRAITSKYKPDSKVTGNPYHTIFIGRLHSKTDEDKLKEKFRKFGKIQQCRVIRDCITGASKCYGFIEFDSRSSTKNAVRTMDRTYIHDCEILVDYECERTLKGWKPRRLGGGFGGKKESGQLRFGGIARPFKKPYESDFDSNSSSTHNLKQIFRQQKNKK